MWSVACAGRSSWGGSHEYVGYISFGCGADLRQRRDHRQQDDTKGRIIYANEVFLRMAGYSETEILNQPHSIIRHPDMPRCVFKLLWDTIAAGKEIFAYVKNRAKNGDHYWVLAHVTPTFDKAGTIISYHSNRRSPRREAVEKAEGLYRQLLAIEQSNPDRKAGMDASFQAVLATLQNAGVPYDEFVFTL